MNTNWSEFWVNAGVALPASIVVAFVQVSRDTPIIDAIIGAALMSLVVTLLLPFVRRWTHRRPRKIKRVSE